MSWKPDRYAELRSFLRRNRVEEDVDEELRHHLEMRMADNVAAGMNPTAARADAARRFGNYDRIRVETAGIDRLAMKEESRMELLGTLRREIAHAFRSIFRERSFAAVCMLTLAIGFGGVTAIFALVDSVLINPLPYAASDRLVYISSSVPKQNTDGEWRVSAAGYFHFVQANRSFDGIGAYMSDEVNVLDAGPAERSAAVMVTNSLLDVLGARTAAGRLFTESEDRVDGPGAVILSHAYWRTRYGSSPDVIGRTIRVNGTPSTVVGVMTDGFEPVGDAADMWLPLRLDPSTPPENSHYLSVVARLGDGVSLETARADVARMTSQFVTLFPQAYSEAFMEQTGFATKIVPLRDHVVGDVTRVLWLVFAAVGLVLLIACANVANLFLVRTEGRRREIALRSALGAGRGRLAVHYIAESTLLCVLAALLGFVLAGVGLQLLLTLSPAGIPRLAEVRLGARTILFALACAALAGVFFGLFPVLHGSRGYAGLREGGRSVTASRSGSAARSFLVVTQVAMSLLLLGGAGLMLRSFDAMRRANPGVQPDGVLTFEVSLPRQSYDTNIRQLGFIRSLDDRLSALPGVTQVGVGNYIPLRGDRSCATVYFEGRVLAAGEVPPCVFTATAAPGFFEALGMRVRGRELTWRDVDVRSDAILVTDAFARAYWPGEDPIGKGLRQNSQGDRFYRVVGVVENARDAVVSQPDIEGVFYPVVPLEGAPLWGGGGALTVVMRTAAVDPMSMVPGIRAAMAEIDAAVPLANAQLLTRTISRSMHITTFTMLLLVIAATMSLLLSAVGLYGMIAYVVTQRRAELGVRLALGARPPQVRAMVLKQSLRLAAAGVLIGAIASIATTRTLASLLYGVAPNDPLTLAIVALLLIMTAALASWVPARRAGRVQPMQVLREE